MRAAVGSLLFAKRAMLMLPQRSRLERQPWHARSRLWETLEWRLLCWLLLLDRTRITLVAVACALVAVYILAAVTT